MKEKFEQKGYVIPENGIDTVKNGKEMQVRFHIEKDASEGASEDAFECESVVVPRWAEYGDVVSAIIDDRYPADKMQAVINNHLLGDESKEGEYEEMQAWRAEAKRVARLVVPII